jgi:E3 ubiquitin-protein ligase SHPRH
VAAHLRIIDDQLLTRSQTHAKAMALMGRIRAKADTQTLVTIPEIMVDQNRGGIENTKIVDVLDHLCDALNTQAAMIDDWREEMVRLVLEPLMDGTEENADKTGREWEESIAIQGKLEAFVKVLDAAIADRECAITGGVNARVEHELSVARREAEEDARAAEAETMEDEDPIQMSEENRMLLILIKARDEHKPEAQLGSVRECIAQLRSLRKMLEETPTDRNMLESQVVGRHLNFMSRQSSQQIEIARALRKELTLFSSTIKARMEYYNHLQQISDSLSPYAGPKDDDTLERWIKEETSSRDELRQFEMKEAYFTTLRESGGKIRDPCIICSSPFEKGILTACGHLFCQSCMQLWWRAHANCPMCKTRLKRTDLLDVFIRSQEMSVRNDTGSDPYGDRRLQRDQTIYAEFDIHKVKEIKAIDLPGGARRSSKVDMMIRHILWLREADPGSKSIIFSSFPSVLEVVQSALVANDVKFATMKDRHGVASFKDDSTVEVFVLSAQAHASGLNLVEANHMFLCEPLLNTALELQAIARIDRIGQKHETNVWLYLVKGSVEESIYQLGVKRRLEHLGAVTRGPGSKGKEPARGEDERLEEANRVEVENSRLSKLLRREGEVVEEGDYLRCLFGEVL